MSSELERSVHAGQLSVPSSTGARPAFWTPAAVADRRHAAEHLEMMRQLSREVELEVGRVEAALVRKLAVADAWTRASADAKFKLHHARKVSQVLDDGDPELSAKFAMLDDDLFHKLRLHLAEWE